MSNNWKTVRVFISSTFRDMQAERDWLVKRVFPALRQRLEPHRIHLVDIDLRWGITKQQADNDQVLGLCLQQIDECRPFFLGLLGGRYGWVPAKFPVEVGKRYGWTQAHTGKSVTELEILHGVLNNPKMAGHAFFYFRDPAYANDPSLADDERREMGERNIPAEVARYGEAEATRRTEARKAKLAALKQRIRASNLPLVDPYANPEALAETVRKQFDELIDRLYPEDQTPDPLTQERLSHEAHAKNKLFGCIERPAHMKALTDFADRAVTEGKGLVLTGESGGGKTAMLAAWARDWAKDNPGDWLFQHYFGATPESASPDGFQRRLMGELKQRFGIAGDIPSDPEKLRDALPVWLAMTPRDVQIALVLDGLNQVQGGEADRRLRFLPRHFPPHVTVIASALPGPALDALRELGWTEYELPKATEAEADAMVAEYLRQIGRFVDAEGRPIKTPLRRQIVAAPGSRNPLFLRTVLEELRQFGSFEKLPARVAHYLEARDAKELFLRVIRRWQEDFDSRDPKGRDLDLVRRALTHLWAARQGLSESEWLDLLGMDDCRLPIDESQIENHKSQTPTPLPRALWTPFFLALEPHLSQRAGLFAYGHDFLRQAVEQTWLTQPDAQCAAQLTIADYFELHPNQAEMTPHKAAEWPFQLYAVQSWERLEACLTNIPLFLALYNERTKWELTGYWHPLRTKPPKRDMGACYAAADAEWSLDPSSATDHRVPNEIALFLLDNGLCSHAEPLLRRAIKVSGRALGPEHPATLAIMNNLAYLLESKGDYANAEPLYRRALGAQERVLGSEHLSSMMSTNNLAGLLLRRGDYVGAETLYNRAIKLRTSVLGAGHPDTLSSMNGLALVWQGRGDLRRAQWLLEQAIESSEQVLGRDHPNTFITVSNLAEVLSRECNFSCAKQMFHRALEASERVLGPENPISLGIVNGLAYLLLSNGDCTGAEPLVRHALVACERVLGLEHPDTLSSKNNNAILLVIQGEIAGAEQMCRCVLDVRERVIGPEHPDTLVSVYNLAQLLANKGDYAGAQPLYERALEGLLGISQALHGPHPNLTAVVGNYAPCLEKLGRSREQIESTLAEMGGRYGIDLAVSALSPEQQRDALRQQAMEKEKSLGLNHPDTVAAINQLAKHLESMDAFHEAEAEYRKALDRAPANMVVLGNYAFFLQNFRRDFAGARDHYLRALQADPNDAINHTNFAGLCLIMDNLGEAEEHLREAWRHIAGKADRYTARALFLRAALAAVRNEDAAPYLGQFKTLFDQGIQPMPSRNVSVREYLQQRLPSDALPLFDALYAAINEPDGLAKLSARPDWQAIQPVTLDTPWPVAAGS